MGRWVSASRVGGGGTFPIPEALESQAVAEMRRAARPGHQVQHWVSAELLTRLQGGQRRLGGLGEAGLTTLQKWEAPHVGEDTPLRARTQGAGAPVSEAGLQARRQGQGGSSSRQPVVHHWAPTPAVTSSALLEFLPSSCLSGLASRRLPLLGWGRARQGAPVASCPPLSC